MAIPKSPAAKLGLTLTNLGCPGETASSFVNATAASNGCENRFDPASQSQVDGGYRTLYPLHTGYTGSQLVAAKQLLRAHPNTRLVTLTMGAGCTPALRVPHSLRKRQSVRWSRTSPQTDVDQMR